MKQARGQDSRVLMLMKTAAWSLALSVIVAGCARPVVKPAEMSKREFLVPCSEKQVRSGVGQFAEALGFSMKAPSQAGAPIVLERSDLTLEELDAFCEFPFRDRNKGTPVTDFWEWQNWWGEKVHGADVVLDVSLAENSSAQTAVGIRGTWSALSTDYSYSGEVNRPFALNSSGVLEAGLQRTLLASCAGKPGPDISAEVAVLSEQLQALRIRYNDGKVRRKTYAAERDGLIANFQNEAG